jgi:hypothetical protein
MGLRAHMVDTKNTESIYTVACSSINTAFLSINTAFLSINTFSCMLKILLLPGP